MDILSKWKFPLLLGILFSVLYLHYFENRAFVELDISVSQETWFKVYWEGDGQPYSEKNVARIRVSPEKRHYSFYLTDLHKVRTLRIDPHQYQGESLLCKLLISQTGLHPFQFASPAEFSRLLPVYGIGSSTRESNGLVTASTGVDPRYEFAVTLQKAPYWSWGLGVRLGAIFGAIFVFFACTERVREEEVFIPLFFSAVFALVIVMAAVSGENVHPDEYVHLDAAEYYKTNWLPPQVDDPAIQHTYSVYGVSRLNSPEVSYLLMGKLAELVSSLKVSHLLGLRLFNILLFGILLLYLLKHPEVRFMAAPLIISPQLWYLFSYCNSDAFALALSFFAACQVVLPGSLLNRYLLGSGEKGVCWTLLLLGGGAALLFLLKKNYWFFLAFLVGYLGWRVWFLLEAERRRTYLKRLAAIVLVGLLFAGLRIGLDYTVNGLDRGIKLEQVQEDLATTLYKPSTPLDQKHIFLYRKARGDTLKDIIVLDRWFEKTFDSAFGMYGYFTVAGSDFYYNAVRALVTILLAYVMGVVVTRGGVRGNLLLAYFLSCSGALIAASLYHSWAVDYQSQGRYLFPLIPMSCVLFYHSRRILQGALLRALLSGLFLLSLYSFVFVALLRITKLS